MTKRKRLEATQSAIQVTRRRYEHPIPSREFILETLRKAGRPLAADELASRLT